MPTESKLTLDVSELLDSVGARDEVRFSEVVPDLQIDLARVDEPLRFELTVEHIEDGILVRGPVTGRFVETCRRCLSETARELRFDVAEIYRPPSDVWEEGYVISEETVDLRPLIRDNVLPQLPLYPLCRDDCRGLCSRCGQDLNDRDCGCDRERVDVRWSALRDLLPEN